MQARFSLTPKLVRSLAVLVILLPFHAVSTEGPDGARIVNGLTSHDLPTVAVLLSNDASGYCSGTLIGCETVLTAAHCVEGETPSNNFVFLQNVGTVSVTSITVHPSYTDANFPIADVAVLKLGSLVTGVDPMEINQIDPNSVIPGASGIIAGYGITLGSNNDFGIKRFGRVETVNCNRSVPSGAGNEEVICWNYETPVGPPGDDSNTCSGDSGGPLFMDLGAGEVVAGTTSGGFVLGCDTDDHSYNANVYTYRSFILSELGADSTSACGSLAPVGDPNTIVLGNDGSLGGGNLEDTFSFVVNPNTPELRVALNTEDTGSFDADLYVRFGAPATSSTFDCAIDISSPYGGCSFASPSAGTWHVLVNRDSGSGDYQVTTTIFSGDPSVCGNLIIEAGEECDDGNTTDDDGCLPDCQLEFELISGKGIVLKDKDADASKRALILRSYDTSIVPAPPGHPGDPTLEGAELRIVNPTSGEEEVIPLPAGSWVGLGSPPGMKGYKYADKGRANGPCKISLVRSGQLKAACKGSQIGFTLNEPSQGSITAIFTLGEVSYCMSFGAEVKEQPALTGTGKTGRFRAKDAPVPSTCPLP